MIEHTARSPQSHLEMCLHFSGVISFMLFFLQTDKVNTYWRGYFWLCAVSPEPLNIPTYPYFWQPLLGLSSKSEVRRVAASLGRTLHAFRHPIDAAKRCAYDPFSGG